MIRGPTRRNFVEPFGTEANGEDAMAEAGGGRAEMERRLIQRSLEDAPSGNDCSTTPGRPPPEAVRMVAVRETPDTVYLVLPSTAEGAE